MPKKVFDISGYLKYSLESLLKLNIEVRKISDPLIIEKVEFMKIEMVSDDNIFSEIIRHEYELLEKIPLIVINDSMKPSFPYEYVCKKERALIYTLWIDREDNLIKHNTTDSWYIILSEGFTYSLN